MKLQKALSRIRVKSYGYRANEVVLKTLRLHGPKTARNLAKILQRDKRTVS